MVWLSPTYVSIWQAYRLEPLILKHYSTMMPLRVHHYDSTKKTPYDQMSAVAYAALKTKPKPEDVKKKDAEKLPKKTDTKVVRTEDDGRGNDKESGGLDLANL